MKTRQQFTTTPRGRHRDVEPDSDPYTDDFDQDEHDDLDDDELDEDLAELGDRRNRLVAILSTSYGASIGLHIVLLLILAGIWFAVPTPTRAEIILHAQSREEAPVDPLAPLEMEKKLDIPLPEIEDPVIPIEEPTIEPPKGEPEQVTNKEQKSYSFVDAIGAGAGGTGAYGSRFGTGRGGNKGGGKKAEILKDAALEWLARHQSADGSWDSNGWQSHCRDAKNPCHAQVGDLKEQGEPPYDVGITGLATLAFLGDGNTARHGKWKVVVKRALDWLKAQQRPDGSIGFFPHQGHTIYNHALATMALCESHAMSKDLRYAKAAKAAVDFCLIAQNPGQGWRYGIKPGQNDTSVTGWMVLALKAARTAEFPVPDEAFQGARNWFDRATSTAGDTGYITPGGGSSYMPENRGRFEQVPCMTAVAVICRIFTGQRLREEQIVRGQEILMKSLPRWSETNHRDVNFYYWYYGTYAMFQIGGRDWKTWNEAMLGALVPNARTGDTCERGSWDPVGEWCRAGGRVYATAINALTLETYYRYERMHKKGSK